MKNWKQWLMYHFAEVTIVVISLAMIAAIILGLREGDRKHRGCFRDCTPTECFDDIRCAGAAVRR